MKFLMRALLAILLYSGCTYAEEFLDFKTQMENRTRIYPLENYERIYIISPSRTGSTVVCNVMRFLFEPQLVETVSSPDQKVHRSHLLPEHLYQSHQRGEPLKDDGTLYFYTKRHPVEICFSLYRINYHSRNLQKIAGLAMGHFRNMSPVINDRPNFVPLEYEDFNENFDYLFSVVERELKITIFEEDKILLKKMLSKENVIHQVEHLDNFNQFDTYNHFHGNHIDRGEISKDEELSLKNQFLELLRPHQKIIEHWGYTLPDQWN